MEDFIVQDNVLTENELRYWVEQVNATFAPTGEAHQSTTMTLGQYEGTYLYTVAQAFAEGMALIHGLLFNIVKGMDTEMHQDIGEYCVCFYPVANPGAPLRTADRGDVAVLANRVVAFDCTKYVHQQVVPSDDTSRFSVVFKFRKAG